MGYSTQIDDEQNQDQDYVKHIKNRKQNLSNNMERNNGTIAR